MPGLRIVSVGVPNLRRRRLLVSNAEGTLALRGGSASAVYLCTLSYAGVGEPLRLQEVAH
jgi:hypothetical protein